MNKIMSLYQRDFGSQTDPIEWENHIDLTISVNKKSRKSILDPHHYTLGMSQKAIDDEIQAEGNCFVQ